MLDRELLKDIGFERGTGWDHEVWVYDGEFWIHYGDYDHEQWPDSSTHVNGTKISRKELLRLFIERVKQVCHESHMELTEDW